MALNYGAVMGPSYAQGRSMVRDEADRMSNVFAQLGGTLADMDAMDSEAIKERQELEKQQKLQEIYQQGLDEWDSEDSSLYQDLDDEGKFRKFASLVAPYDMKFSQELLDMAEDRNKFGMKAEGDPDKQMINKLKNDKSLVMTLSNAYKSQLKNFNSDPTAENKALVDTAKERYDNALDIYNGTYESIYGVQDTSTPDIVEESVEVVEDGGPLTIYEQESKVRELLNSGIEQSSMSEVESFLDANGVLNEDKREKYRKAWKKSALGRKASAQASEQKKKTDLWNELTGPTGSLTKIDTQINSLNSLSSQIAQADEQIKQAKTREEKTAIKNYLQNAIARAYQPTGILTDSDLRNATSTNEFTDLLNKVGYKAIDEDGLSSSIKVIRNKLKGDIAEMNRNKEIFLRSYNQQTGENKALPAQELTVPMGDRQSTKGRSF